MGDVGRIYFILDLRIPAGSECVGATIRTTSKGCVFSRDWFDWLHFR